MRVAALATRKQTVAVPMERKHMAKRMKGCSNQRHMAMQTKSQSLGFDDLPWDALFEIIKRLPLWSLGCLKCTCKAWYSFLMDSKVIDSHLVYSTQNRGFLCFPCSELREVYYVGGEAHGKTIYVGGGEVPIGPATDNTEEINPFDVDYLYRWFPYNFSGSAGGLLAYWSLPPNSTFYICNPITLEHVKVPPQNPEFPYELTWGFGYSSSTKEYKIVKFGYGGVESCIIAFHNAFIGELGMKLSFEGMKPNPIFLGAIYSLGSNSWREISHVPFPPWGLHVDLNGTLFWLIWNSFYEGEERLMSFNIDTQEFKALHGPPIEIAAATSAPMLMKMKDDTLAFVVENSADGFKFWVLVDQENGLWENKGNIIRDNGWRAPWRFLWGVLFKTRWINRQLFIINRCPQRVPWFDFKRKDWRFDFFMVLPHAGSLVSPAKIAGYL